MGILAELEAVDATRLESIRGPEAAHGGFRDTHFRGHRAARPMRVSSRLALRHLCDHLSSIFGRDSRRPSRPGRILHQTADTLFDKPASPKSRHAWYSPIRCAICLSCIPSAASRMMRLRGANAHWRGSPARQLLHLKPSYGGQFEGWRNTQIRLTTR